MEEQLDELLRGLFGGEGPPGAKDGEAGGENAEKDPGGIDPRILLGLMDILGETGREDDGDRLLSSLRPFMSEGRKARVDEAIRVMKLCRAAKSAVKLFGEGRT